MKLSFKRLRSPSGKVYAYSPNPKAVPRLFLIGDGPGEPRIAEEDKSLIRRFPGPGETICPYSGYIGPDEDFIPPDEINNATEKARHYAIAYARDRLKKMVKDFNRRQTKGGFISMEMRLKTGNNPPPRIVHIREDLLREINCEICGRSYGVYAIAVFCPDCGAPNVSMHFRQEIKLIEKQIMIAEEQSSEGNRELSYRLMGNAHEDVLTAFETTLKTIYQYLTQLRKSDNRNNKVLNAFQNIMRIQELFEKFSVNPFFNLIASELDLLDLYIQKRHIIGHGLGIADQRYAELVKTEQTGKTVSVFGEEIKNFSKICFSVVQHLEKVLLPDITAVPYASPDEKPQLKPTLK